MDRVFAFAFASALNPSLLASVMVMIWSARAKQLMFGYLLGAYLTSIAIGVAIVLALPAESAPVSTTRKTLSPAADVALGLIALTVALVLCSGPHEGGTKRWEKRKSKGGERKPPRWRRWLDGGSPRLGFGVAVLLGLPGASYLLALDALHHQDKPAGITVAIVVAICVIQLVLLELPLLGFAFGPTSTIRSVERVRAWISRDARRIVISAAFVVGVLFLLRAAIGILS